VIGRRTAAGVFFMALLLFKETGLAQFAMCRRALDSPEGQQMIAALRGGILVLLVVPFVLFVSIAVLAIRAQRARLDADRSEASWGEQRASPSVSPPN
jgi:hypothetical protein